MKSNVLNNSIGTPYIFQYPRLSKDQEQSILADLFEQLLIFDEITLTTSRINFALTFLIQKININNVERLIDAGYLKFILWSPIIFTSSGMQREDKSIDESVIYGRPPLAAGSLSAEDLNPERNIRAALSNFDIHEERKRNFIKKAVKNYSIPDGMILSQDSAELIIDAYKNNNLSELGLPYEKEPEQLNVKERGRLLELGHKVLETAILSQYNLKSYENFETFKICKNNLENIGKAYNVSENTTNILRLENLPNLKQLFITEKLDFESVFKLRHLGTAKYYRKWINQVGENSNLQEVTAEYLNEIKGNNSFFEKSGGKFLKNLAYLAASTAIGSALAGPIGSAAGFTLGLLENFLVDDILKGKNPSMFINDIKNEIAPPAVMPPL